jgi:hypothetical protein
MGIMTVGLAALVAMVLGSSAAGAAEQVYAAKLDGASEVPKVESKAAAEATFTHIHLGAAGKNGPVVARLYPASGTSKLIKRQDTGELAKGEITAASLQGPEKGKPLSALVKAIQDRDAYVNIHTAEHKTGEIRGQIK